MLPTCDDLPILPHTDPRVFFAAKCFVEAKRLLDGFKRDRGGSLIAAQVAQDVRYDTSEPFAFAYEFLPFFRFERQHLTNTPSTRYKCMVPTSIVLGESWRWKPTSLSKEEQEDVVRIAFDRCIRSDSARPLTDCAKYTYVKPLGIVLAEEGKNRVALFDHLGLTHIPAVVTERAYPQANRLKLIMLDGISLAVLDNRYVQRVVAPFLIQDLLQAYGVSIEKKWPSEFPCLARVMEKFGDLRGPSDFYDHAVDLQDLSDDIEAEETFVRVCLLDIADFELPPWQTFAKVFATMTGCAITAKLAGRWPDIQMLLVAVAGAMYALLFVPFLMVFKCKVKNLKEKNRWSKRFEIKAKLRQGREQVVAAASTPIVS